MEKHLIMDVSSGGLLFQIFYVLAFLISYAILIYEGYRMKFPLAAWILVLACTQLFLVVGTKVFSFTAEEWRFMFQNHTLLPNPEKTLLGGVVMGIMGYLIARYFLKFRYFVLDAFAIAFPVAVSIQALGCFFYGCCFGKPSALPWSVQYPVMTLPHYHQFESGLLNYQDLFSLPVHPVQLYLTVGGLVVAGLVIRFRRYWKAPGSLLLSSAILYMLLKFVLEFFQDPLSDKSGGEMLWIFKQVQWQNLALAFLLTVLLFFREKTYKWKTAAGRVFLPGMNTQIGFLFFLLLVFLMLRNWFTLPEIIALNIALLPALFLIGIEIIREYKSLRFKWLYVCSLLLPPFLMSQTFPQAQMDTAGTKKFNTYHSIGGGLATGNYTDQRHTYTGSGCSTISNDQYFSQKYTAGGLGYQFTKETTNKRKRITYGANIMLGNYTQTRQIDSLKVKILLAGINPFIKYDFFWFGIGGGLHLGSLAYTQGDTFEGTGTIPKEGFLKTPIFPQFYFRAGPVKYFYAFVAIADQLPVSAPGLAYQLGLGSSFGLNNGMSLRLGTSLLDGATSYLSAYIPIKNRIVLEPLFFWTRKEIGNYYPVRLPEKQFSLGVSYRFNRK